jgi:predicted methyltransferase
MKRASAAVIAALTLTLAGACVSDQAATPVRAAETPTALAPPKTTASAAAVLKTLVANPKRSEANRIRDIHRHPVETLTFFGLKPGMTVIEVQPGSYYGEILSPFAKETGGQYIATGNPMKELADAGVWGTPTYVAFNKDSGPLAPAGSADMVLTFRNIHNWMWQPGVLDTYMVEFAAALKPGGVLGVVEHRADPRPETVVGNRSATDGYVAKATIVAAARKAGLVLEAESEINANPKDTKDHPFGVWTLPPNSWTSPRNQGETPAGFDAARYKAIGESDRQTLRFRKPL